LVSDLNEFLKVEKNGFIKQTGNQNLKIFSLTPDFHSTILSKQGVDQLNNKAHSGIYHNIFSNS
jgi:hypothetical protein